MKTLVFILILFLANSTFAQIKEKNRYGPDTQHCVLLDTSLIEKNIKKLAPMLHPALSLGHSNGWIETKESLLTNLPTSNIKYDQFIYHGSPILTFQNEELKSIRRNLTAKGSLDQKDFQVDLKILEVWVKEGSSWLLLSRQSVEVNFEQ